MKLMKVEKGRNISGIMEIESESKKYYCFVDFIKAVAIFFVVFYHCFRTAINPYFSSALDYGEYFIYSALGMGVPLFFMTNGFLLFQKKYNFKVHALKIAKVVIITVIWAIFTLALLMFIRGDSFSVIEFVKGLISLKQGYINHLWFMEALIFVYIIFPFFKWLYDKYFVVFKILSLFAVFYTILIPTYCAINDLFHNLPLSDVLINLPNVYFFFSIGYFMAGGILYKVCNDKKLERKYLVVVIAIILLLLLVHTSVGIVKSKQTGILFDNAWECYHSASVFAAVCLTFFILYKNCGNAVPNIIKKIGSDSLAIYFIHPILICIIMLLPYVEILCRNFVVNLILSVIILLISFFIAEFLQRFKYAKKMVKF